MVLETNNGLEYDQIDSFRFRWMRLSQLVWADLEGRGELDWSQNKLRYDPCAYVGLISLLLSSTCS